tara:strand:- start:449 stop:874 length:426 start_codon:yes stop_codon:yes gene_type:complete
MKLFKYIFILLLIISCGNNKQPDLELTDPLEIQANLLDGKWILKNETSATRDGSVVDDFKNLTLTFSGSSNSGGTYSTSNSIDIDVWPNSGIWSFQNNEKSKLLRNDDVIMNISVTQTTLRISFSVDGGLKVGNWIFDFIK